MEKNTGWAELYITSTGDCSNLPPPPSDGGGVYGGQGDGGWGGDGGGTGHGSGPGPTPRTSVSNMPATKTMSPQMFPGTCVPASLTQVKLSLCGGDEGQVEGAMLLYGLQQYGTSFTNDGVPLSGISDFTNHFFNTTILYPVNDFQKAINNEYPIMVDVFAYMDGPNTVVYHSVIITGYNPNNTSQVYYLDPATGTTKTADGASMLAQSHYIIPIINCK